MIKKFESRAELEPSFLKKLKIERARAELFKKLDVKIELEPSKAWRLIKLLVEPGLLGETLYINKKIFYILKKNSQKGLGGRLRAYAWVRPWYELCIKILVVFFFVLREVGQYQRFAIMIDSLYFDAIINRNL